MAISAAAFDRLIGFPVLLGRSKCVKELVAVSLCGYCWGSSPVSHENPDGNSVELLAVWLWVWSSGE